MNKIINWIKEWHRTNRVDVVGYTKTGRPLFKNVKLKKGETEEMYFKKKDYTEKGIEIRPWGFFKDLSHTSNWHVKTIHVKKDAILSLQIHKKREEHWFVVEGAIIGEVWYGDDKVERILKVGDEMVVPIGVKHRISAYKGDAVLVEISLGKFDENDIKRYDDEYGRS